jgi:hypothetical protein
MIEGTVARFGTGLSFVGGFGFNGALSLRLTEPDLFDHNLGTLDVNGDPGEDFFAVGGGTAVEEFIFAIRPFDESGLTDEGDSFGKAGWLIRHRTVSGGGVPGKR